jgi:hypothetical protein
VQLIAEAIGDGLQIDSVVAGILEKVRGERPARPVGFLTVLVKNHAMHALNQSGQTEFLVTKKLGCDHCVEHFHGMKSEIATQHAQVVVGPVQQEDAVAESLHEGGEFKTGKGVHDKMIVGNGDLDEADFFKIMMQTVGLGVDGYARVAFEAAD